MWRSIQAVVLILTLAICCYFGGSQLLPVMAMEQGGGPVVILDPGHGGEDGGASTASGQQESKINLDIVLKLELLMAFCGVETRLTRDTDVSLHDPGAEETGNRKQSDLDHRVQLVESTPNAMLISIHQNHFSDSRVSGAQVFYSLGDWPRQWGEATQQALVQCLNKSNTKASKPISQGIYLFDHVSCPALLVECGFLSNGEEASLLLTDDYQKRISLAITGAYLQQMQAKAEAMGGISSGKK